MMAQGVAWNAQRGGATAMWGAVDDHYEQNKNSEKEAHIWAIQELTMHSADMNHNMKNEITENYFWVYNELCPMDTAIAITKKKIAAVKNTKKISQRRALLLRATMGRDHYIIVNVHMPTNWQSVQEYRETQSTRSSRHGHRWRKTSRTPSPS